MLMLTQVPRRKEQVELQFSFAAAVLLTVSIVGTLADTAS